MEQYVTYNGKEGSGVITTLTKGKQYKIIEDLETSICIRNDRGQKKYYYRQYFTDTPSPAKAEQEGPKPISSYLEDYNLKGKLVQAVSNYKAEELTVEKVKSLSAEEIYQIICSYRDAVTWLDSTIYSLEEGAGEWESEAKEWQRKFQEQEDLRWVKLEDYKFTPWETVCAKWEAQPGNSRRSCCYRSPDGIITWIGEKPREKVKVYILDESTTPSVKEAGQPRNLPIEELIKLSDKELNVEINKVRSRLGMGKSEEAGQPADDKPFDENLAYELIARFVANSGKKDSIKKIRKEAFVEGALWAKKYLQSWQQPAGQSTIREREVAFAEWIGWDWQRVEGLHLWQHQKTMEVMNTRNLYEKYLENNKEDDNH